MTPHEALLEAMQLEEATRECRLGTTPPAAGNLEELKRALLAAHHHIALAIIEVERAIEQAT